MSIADVEKQEEQQDKLSVLRVENKVYEIRVGNLKTELAKVVGEVLTAKTSIRNLNNRLRDSNCKSSVLKKICNDYANDNDSLKNKVADLTCDTKAQLESQIIIDLGNEIIDLKFAHSVEINGLKLDLCSKEFLLKLKKDTIINLKEMVDYWQDRSK